MNRLLLYLLLILTLWACKSRKKKEAKKDYFAIHPFVESQLQHLDTSIYRIRAIHTLDNRTDTMDIHREQVRAYAKDFLALPDITTDKKRDHYEESVMFDDPTRSILLNYTAIEPEEEVRRETIVLEADEQGQGEVKTIIIDQFMEKGDSTVVKNLLWQAGTHFQVVTKTTRGNKPEEVRIVEVRWD